MNKWEDITQNHTPSTSEILPDFIEKIGKDAKVLEVGCGKGRIIDKCISKGADIYGIDINKNEIEALNSRYKGYKNLHLEVKDIASKKFKLSTDCKFDYIFMNGLLGALKAESREEALKNISELMDSNSEIHLSEFLLFEDNEEMKARYARDLVETGEYGTFFILDKQGKKICPTHNFKEIELENLLLKYFKIIKKEGLKFSSYSGKIKPGIILLLKKI